MPESWFRGLFDTALTTAIAPVDFLLCVGVSLALGLLLCAMTLWRSPFSRSLAVTLAILPAVVCVVIMMVNGNVGTGVAVAGAFNLVRFRSAPGSAREIGAIFVAMGTGLITGMGYLGYGFLFTLILGAAMMLYNILSQGLRPGAVLDRTLHITIPEDLDYAGVFDPILQEYTRQYTLTDGQIVVNAGETDKVQLVLKGADITSSTSAAIYALQADKVFLTLAEGTENTLTNGGEYVAIDDNNIDGVIFAKTDLTLNGSGSLTLNAQAGHGVVSKDDLVITGGSYTVTAGSHGLSAKDSIAIAAGTFAITSGKDGIHAENSEDTSLGYLYLGDGSYTITAQGDAISASGAAQIDGGTYTLTTGEGSASVTMTSSDTAQPGGHGGWSKGTPPDAPDTQAAATQAPQVQTTAAQTETTQTETTQTETDTTDSTSQKGIKAEGGLVVNGGVFTMDTVDDGLHTGADLLVTAGEFTLSSGDDAVHSDAALTIQNGTFTIPYCYEGLEGLSITIEDGTFTITSHDDGLNAAGGADSSGFGGFGAGPQDAFSASSDSFIVINGGTFTVVSSGDCIDSNGDMTINGGTLDLTCNGAGDTALDCDGTFTHNGGDLTTNDGSEDNPGQMGGGILNPRWLRE